MTESKTKYSARNAAFGFVLKIVEILVPFIVRTAIIKVLGLGYAGLNSLFTSVLSVLNIAELGVGFTLVYSMYKPISDGDEIKICALMKLYRMYYRVIGVVILVLGLSIVPILPNLITGSVPEDINLYLVYFLNLGATVVSYWLFAYKKSLFSAHQRNDIISKIKIVTDLIKYTIQIVLLFVLKNYYIFLIVALAMQLVDNILNAIVATKMYPNYKAIGDIDAEERKRINTSIKDVFMGQLGYVVTTSVDAIVISSFLGLVPLAIYQNYYYILNAIIGFFTIFYHSCRASIGMNLIKKTNEENFKDFRFISFIVMFLLAFCISCLICVYQPFMRLWIGEEGLLDTACVILFGIYLLTYETCLLLGCYKDSSGKWHADRFRPLITAIANLTINITLVNLIGIYGILISTIVSYLFVNIPWLFSRLFKDVFLPEFRKNYFFFILRLLAIVVALAFVSYIACSFIALSDVLTEIMVRLFVCSGIVIPIYMLLNANSVEAKRYKSVLKKVIKR